MKLEINIDCKKTENALKAVSCILKTPMSKISEERIAKYVLSFSKMVRDEPEINELVKSDFPEQYKLLMEVL